MPIGGGGGGTPFNGGTITSGLVVDTAATTGQALELQGTRTSAATVFGIDYPHTVVAVDSDGVASFASDDAMGFTVEGSGDSGATLTVLNQPTTAHVNVTAAAAGCTVSATAANNVPVAGMGHVWGLMTALNTAPTDGSIVAGQACIWFDQTDGAAKLMVKAKTANGTVVTAAVALA